MKPYVTLNFAMSLDGFIGKSKSRVRFSNKKDKERVHKLRAKSDAIMVGINTVITDNPHLTVRHASGRNPVRVVVDSMAKTPFNSNVLDDSAPTIIAVSRKASEARKRRLRKHADVIVAGDRMVNLKQLLKKLSSLNIKSVLLEGGGTLNKSMLNENLVDEIYLTIAPILLGSGIRWINGLLENKNDLRYIGCKVLGNQVVLHYKVK